MAQATFPDDVLPPEGTYDSREALLAVINEWAAPRGYAFITGRSSRSTSGRQIVTYACDRWCRPPSASKDRQRKTTTRGTNCRFSIIAKESLDKATWSLRHRPDSRFSLHNHEPSWHKSAHPVHRQLSDADKSTISRLTNAGVAPKDIRTYIRQNSNTIATQQDIYNRIADSKRELCEGQSTIHAFANQMDKEGFWSRMRLDSDDRVTAVLFAHPESLAYLQAYPDLLFLDCTYKTNKYGMPLLDMIGVDACQRSFCIAFAFLSGETEQDYLWALDRLRSLYELCNTRLPSVILTDRDKACMNAAEICFPSSISLLCLWHANKAVLRYCQPTFVRHQQGSEAYQQGLSDWSEFFNHWHSIMKSPDEEAFDQRVQELERCYLPQYIEEVGYIKANWLDPYKEKLVKAWVDQHPHFGNVVTSRVEGIHGLLKSHLKKSTLDLFEAWRAMKHALLNQLAELRSNQASQQMRIPIELSGSLYSAIRGWVSHEALRKVEEQRKLLLKENLPSCTGAFSRSHGLPCAHTLKALQEQGQALRLEHFHTHWHLNRHGVHQLLLEPRHRPDRIVAGSTTGRPQSSTLREPSAFEAVQATVRPKAQPKCSRCHQVGHRMTSKACPQRYEELLQSSASSAHVGAMPAALPSALSGQVRPVPTISSSAPSLQAGEALRPMSSGSSGQERPIRDSASCIVVSIDDTDSTVPAASSSAPSAQARMVPAPRYDDPRAIYQRYVAARDAWYKAQPRGSIKTNQQYRRALGLPLRYDKSSYQWCLDWKQMGKRCDTPTGSRDWTKEEMMAYLDWSKAEDDRVEAQVATEMERIPFSSRRGMCDIWEAAAADGEAQQAIYSGR
ncbi:hypothetical protein FALCPG4_18973 [Fusarium falciforme]